MSISLKVTCKSSVEIFSTDKFGFSCDLFSFSSPLMVQISSLAFTESKVSGIWESFGDSIFDSHSSFCWVSNKSGLISESIYNLVLSCSISMLNFFNLGWKVENNKMYFGIIANTRGTISGIRKIGQPYCIKLKQNKSLVCKSDSNTENFLF